MELYDLINNLAHLSPKRYGEQNNSCDLQTVRLFVKGQTFFDSSILYLSESTHLPNPKQPENFTVVCCGCPTDWSLYEKSTFSILYLGDAISYQELFNTIQEQMAEIQQINTGMHLLANALFSEQGLQHLVDTGAKVFGNPVYVIDLQHKYLAISSGISANDPFLQQENQFGYISDEGVRLIQHYKLDEKIRKHQKPYFFDNPLNHQCMLIDIIQIQGIEVGHVMIQECEHKFYEFDAVLLQRFSKLISMELQKDRIFQSNKGMMYSYFLADLLKNSNLNSVYIKDRLKSLGYNLREDLYIIAIPSSSYHAAPIRLEVIVEQLRHILSGSIYVIYEDSIVFLVSRERFKGLSSYELERLSDFLSANQLKAGVSNFYTSLNESSRFYHQALQAVEMGVRLSDPNSICYYREYYIYQMLEFCEKQDSEIRYLIHPGLMHLYYYEKEKSADFLHTLKVYLTYPGQPAKIAERLHIHKNTLLYRMTKIKEIINCKLEEGDEFIYLGLSFKIMEYLHMI